MVTPFRTCVKSLDDKDILCYNDHMPKYPHPDKSPERSRLRLQRNRQAIHATRQMYKQVNCCFLCGGKGEEFHHVDPYNKTREVSLVNQSITQLVKEMLKCWLLCSDCHKKLHLGVLCVLPQYYTSTSKLGSN